MSPSTRSHGPAPNHGLDSGKETDNPSQHPSPAVWCLAELEKSGSMHPDTYPDNKAPANDDPTNGHTHDPALSMNASHGGSKPTAPAPVSPSKRKHSTSTTAQASKAAKPTQESNLSATSDPIKTLRFLISTPALPLCSPAAEADLDSTTRTYSTAVLNPFEELLCAAVVARSASHGDAYGAIRKLLNPPYAFSSPAAVLDAGMEGWRGVMGADELARVLEGVASSVVKLSGGSGAATDLATLRGEGQVDVDGLRETLIGAVEGMGNASEEGIDIFLARAQWMWEEVYPFVDARAGAALEKLGLPTGARELRKLMEGEWDAVNCVNIGIKDDERKKRRAFVVVLDRAVGADLEDNTKRVLEEAAKLG